MAMTTGFGGAGVIALQNSIPDITDDSQGSPFYFWVLSSVFVILILVVVYLIIFILGGMK